MCDTLYAGRTLSGTGSAWFAKNSDRHPDEPQALCLVPRRAPAPALSVGGRTFPGPDAGLAYALSKPSWMAGGEAGVNERGVAIGNEAVFSRWKPAKDGPLGMDLLRAALASATSAEEARDYLASAIEREGQGGNGAYKGSLRYDNSFIVADPTGAYVLETAGRRWAWRPAGELATISNAYSIEDDYKRLDEATRKAIAPVNERAACSDEADPGRKGHKDSWRPYVESRFYLRFTKGDVRRGLTRASLEAARGGLGLAAVLGTLRDHGAYDPRRRGSLESPCVHAGAFPSDSATTASLALEYLPGGAAFLWFTGTSYPCVSIYKPVLLSGGEFLPLWTDYDYAEGSEAAYAHWSRQRTWIRRAKAGRLSLDPAFAGRRDAVQDRIARAAAAVAAGLAGGATASAGAAGQGAASLGGVAAAALEEARREIDAAVESWYSGLPGY